MTLTSAPAPMRAWHTARWPLKAAHSSGVSAAALRASTAAPFAMSASAPSGQSACMAHILTAVHEHRCMKCYYYPECLQGIELCAIENLYALDLLCISSKACEHD
jgi:hypothetical protein